MSDIHGSPGAAPQMPSAPNPGPAPVPYQGADLSPEPPDYAAAVTGFGPPGPQVMDGIAPGNAVQESSYAHDVNAGLVTPYYAGDISSIYTGSNTAGPGGDDVAGTVAGAVTAAESRFAYHQEATLAQGSTIGDLMTIPPNSMDPAVGVQGLEGSYYDPPRDY